MVKFLPRIVRIVAFFISLFEKKPEPGRKLIDKIPDKPERLRSDGIRKIMQGNYADLGRDVTTEQRFLLDEDARCKNTVVLGPTGAGKSSWIIATTLSADILKRGNSVFVFDGMNDFTPKISSLCKEYRRDLYVYPDIGFNPLNLIKSNPQDRARVFNDVLAQVTQVSDEARFYLERQQLFIRQVLPLYEAVYKQPMILRELWELCLRKDVRERLVKDAGSNRLAQDYKYTVGAWKDTEADRNLSGLVNFIDAICSGQNAHFYNQRFAPTIEDIIDKKEVCVIREGDDKGTEGHIRGLLYMVAIQEATKRRAENSHFLAFYIDEFHRYLNPSYPPFIATSRKRRIAQVLAFQTLSQLTDSKGNDYGNTIMSNARTCVVHTGLSPEDAEYIAECIGKRQFIYTSTMEQRSRAEILKGASETKNLGYDYVLFPHEIRNLDQNLSIILSVKERGLDAPRLVEKPIPLKIQDGAYKIPVVEPIAPPTIWDMLPLVDKKVEPPAKGAKLEQPVAKKEAKEVFDKYKLIRSLDKVTELDKAVDDVLDKAKKNNENKQPPKPQPQNNGPKQQQQNNPKQKPKRGRKPPQKKEGEV
jgi:hypothetical protein